MGSYAQQRQGRQDRPETLPSPGRKRGDQIALGDPQAEQLETLQRLANDNPHARKLAQLRRSLDQGQQQPDLVLQMRRVGDVIRAASDRVPGYFVEITAKSNRLEDNKYRLDIATVEAEIKRVEKHIENRNEKRSSLTPADPQYAKVQAQLQEYLQENRTLVARKKALVDKGTLYGVKTLDGSNTTLNVYGEDLGQTPVGTPASENKFKEELNRHTPFIYIPQVLETSEAPKQEHMVDLMKKFVAFRSDSRPPAKIFKTGFTPREQHVAPIYRFDEQDIHSASAVSASRNPAAAAMFPLPGEETLAAEPGYADSTYLYAFIPNSYINTNQIQEAVRSGAYPGGNVSTTSGVTTREMAGANLYGAEIVVPSVPGLRVIAAWRIDRKWAGDTYRDGCSYKVKGGIMANPGSAPALLGNVEKSTYFGDLSSRVRSKVDGRKSPKP